MTKNKDRINYATIKRIAKEEKKKVKEFFVLSSHVDPFYVGSKTRTEMAEWFSKMWETFGYTSGVHLRRVHYRLTTSRTEAEPFTRADGKPYRNTENDWNYLAKAGAYARHLGLVDKLAFVDRRNAPPIINNEHDITTSTTPNSDVDLSWDPHLYKFEEPEVFVDGYSYRHEHQPYYVEVWIEKSTMNDELLPLGRELGFNVLVGTGEQSITNTVKFLLRVAQIKKPTRILYISDYDPAGESMPRAVARKLEFYADDLAPGADVGLKQIMLTRDQVKKYELPRTPLKESLRGGRWEEENGEGAVELDALEALYPGEFENVIRKECEPYIDVEYQSSLEMASEQAMHALSDRMNDFYEQSGVDIDVMRTEINRIVERANGELQPWREQYGALKNDLKAELQNVILPERPEPITMYSENENELMYHSTRDYFEQLEYYKNDTQ